MTKVNRTKVDRTKNLHGAGNRIAYMILAAGVGSRLKSNLAKGMLYVAGKPILEHLVGTLERRGDGDIFIVVKTHQTQIRAHFGERVTYVEQSEPLGTGHAVLSALPALGNHDRIIILPGDLPFLSAESLENLINEHQLTLPALTLLTARLDNPFGYGRIIRDENGVKAIVEEKDATAEQRKIQEINTSVMLVERSVLDTFLPKIQPQNAQKEYYLTDLVLLLVGSHYRVLSTHALTEEETRGINTMQDMMRLERWYQYKASQQLMTSGVHLMDANRFDLRGDLSHGKDCLIDVNVIVEGNVSLGNNIHIGAGVILQNCTLSDGVRIEPNCIVRQCTIGENTIIKSFSHIDGTPEKSSQNPKDCCIDIGKNCQIGPYARIRPETKMSDAVHMGNFVELKKVTVGKSSKINHLSYIGDTVLGEECNIGAGTITCNYDGKNKMKTIIGDRVFIGSNCALVAPITLGDGVYIAAGSTITQSVDSGLALARTRQENKPEWKPKHTTH